MPSKKYTVENTGARLEAVLNEILSNAGFDLSFQVVAGESSNPEIENPELVVKFSGSDVDLLLSNRAELLLSLEHVVMECLRVPSEDHSLVSFDANDYRVLRIEELRVSAAAASEKVKHTGVPFRFNPMNSRERRVIHIALRNETELRSESSGAAGYRHVVIYPAGMASLPDPPPPPPYRSSPPRDRERGGDRGGSRGGDRGRGDRGGRPSRPRR